jgi:CDP-glycerol glycerophosphotransferase
VPIKKIGFDSRVEQAWIQRKLRQHEPLPYDEWDIFVAQCDFQKEIIESAFKIESSRIIVEEPDSISYLRDKAKGLVESEARARVILYAPTFRNDGSDRNVILEAIDRISGHFDMSNSQLWVKVHPLLADSCATQLSGDVRIIEPKMDVFDLLAQADVLVSDYSSVIYDYSALGRPIFLCQPDKDAYERAVGGLYRLNLDVNYI